MDPFLFGSTSNELLAVLILAAAATVAGLAFGTVHLVRFFRTRKKRSLYLGLALLVLVPLLSYLALCLDATLIRERVGPDLVDPDFFQHNAQN